jgi:hypothetical protein
LGRMMLYNVTIGIDKAVEAEWLTWMRDHHIPAVMATGYFYDYKMYKVLHDQGEETTSYSVQFFAPSIKNVVAYLELSAPVIMNELKTEFRDRHVAFQTLLEEV